MPAIQAMTRVRLERPWDSIKRSTAITQRKEAANFAENLELSFAGVVRPELEEGEEIGKEQGESKARKGRTDFGKPASAQPASPRLCHEAPPYADRRNR
jgi:hypothetical protein